MALSTELISQFAKVIVKDEPRPESITVVGTAKLYDGKIYVQIDGSNGQLTPIASSTVGMKDGDRVTVQIKNHSATVTGNATDPSAGKSYADEIDGKVDNVSDQISEFEIIIADKVDVDQINAVNGRIDNLVSENVTITGKLDAVEANIGDLTADNVTINEKLTAAEADIDHLESSKADITVLESEYATIENLNATNATINNLEATYTKFEQTTTNRLEANEAEIAKLDAEKLSATDADIKYANIDFTNIGVAAVEELFAKSGIIEDLVVSGGHITGELVGVTIKGDLIEGNTIKADKLVVLGSDGLYYKLNVNAETVAAEQTDYNSLNGSIITANTITAEKINVDDLVAFNATIGGYHISDGSLYSGAKNSATNTTRGVYLGDDGQFAVGDSNNYLKFYNDNGTWKLEISANTIKMGAKSVEEYVDEKISEVDVKLTEQDCGDQPHVFGKNGGRAPYELKVYGQTRQNLWSNLDSQTVLGITVTSNSDGSITLSGTSTSANVWIGYKKRYNLRPGSTYTLSVDNTLPSGTAFRVEPRDADGVRLPDRYLLEVTGSKKTATATIPSNTAYVNCLFYCVAPVGTTLSGTYRVMLNEGSEAEPWCPPGLNGVDELSIVTAGKNLAKLYSAGTKNGVTTTVNDDGSITVSGTNTGDAFGAAYSVDAVAEAVDAAVGCEITVSLKGGVNGLYLHLNGYPLGGVDQVLAGANERNQFVGTDTIPDGFKTSSLFLGVSPGFSGAVTVYPQLEIGSTATSYEPPAVTSTPVDLDGHTLNSLPDGTRDELSVDATGAVTLVQRVGDVNVPSGTALSYDNENNHRFNATITSGAGTTDYENGYSDKLPVRNDLGTSPMGVIHSMNANVVSFYANKTIYSSSDAAKTAVQSVLPARLLYELATPQTISLGHVDLPAVPADNATIWFSVPTGLSPDTCAEIWTEEGAKVADAQKDAYEATQGAVKSQVVTYQAGTSGTTVPIGSWVPSPPSVPAGQYLWTRTVTTYVSGRVVTAYSVARQGQNGSPGAPGADGTDGRGIKTTAVTYQAHSSQTSTPTGSWSGSIPKLSASKPYLWTRTIITYTDSTTSTSYSVSSTLDGVEVGGRNLIKNSTFDNDDEFWVFSNIEGYIGTSSTDNFGNHSVCMFTQTAAYPTGGRVYPDTVTNFTHIRGKMYTLSFYTNIHTAGMRIKVAIGGNDVLITAAPSATNTWTRYTVTYTSTGIGSLSFWADRAGEWGLAFVKLEYGNIASDWTPAPEDVDQSIQTARDQIITETQAYSENLNDSLTDYVGKTFYTKEEGSDLKTEVGEISTKLTQTENQFEMNFTNVSNRLANLSESTADQFDNINKYIRFLNGDIILGEEGNATTLKIENDRIAFLDSNNEVMYITDQELYIMKAIIATQLTIGKFSWVPRSNGNVSFRYIG